MLQVGRLIGSAGSGKTTELMRIMDAALPRIGNDPLRLGFASMTRAARAEAVSRASAAWNVPPALLEQDGWFRTVHSVAKRCLEVPRGQLLGGTSADAEWISEAVGARVQTTVDEDTGEQRFVGGPEGAAITCWQLARNVLQPLESVVRRVRQVDDQVPDYAAIVRTIEHYETAKRLHNRCDFADLLMRFAGIRMSATDGAYRVEPQGYLPPVTAWLFDEQQDASPLLDAACKRLVSAETVKWCYVVGDPFQSIFGFAGSSAECFLGWQAAKERTMPKSYRCPAPILELGERWLRRMTRDGGYFDRKVTPADHEGRVMSTTIDVPVLQARPDEDWLFIARTNYDATRLFAAIQAAGKPARWVKSDGATARSEGLAALYTLERGKPVSGKAWGRAIELLPIVASSQEPMLVRGTKTGWAKKNAETWDLVFPNELTQVGATPQLAERITTGRWVGLVDRGEQWRRQAAQWGIDLASRSGIRVGTIHSVKGAEADNVAMLTTYSKRVEQGAADSAAQHDEECRLAYVGVTRARRNLYVMDEYRLGRPVPSMEML